MTQDNELRELRDTLAIEITREMIRTAGTSWDISTYHETLAGVYGLADAVLSGRHRTPYDIKRLEGSEGQPHMAATR